MPGKLKHPLAFERGNRLFLVGPLAPMQPSDQQIEEFAFADAVTNARDRAPNQNIAWFGGHYVEADTPNGNGAMWTSDELAIKAVTPMLMPVTVMHDPSTAVGTIADTVLKTPDADQVPKSKIETALALWTHRFPEVVDEAMHNYSAGLLMQSMECFAPDYSCSECGMSFHKLPEEAERENWCEHLIASNPTGGYVAGGKGESSTAVRILRNVCFTGTGLIFGTRGAQGADSKAYLESFQEEVAQFHDDQHERARHQPKRRPKRTRRTSKHMDPVEIAKSEYEELLRAKSERDAAVKRADEADEAVAVKDTEIADLKPRVEKAEADLKTSEEAREAAEKKVEDAEESARAEKLRTERMDKLGKGFRDKLGEKTSENLADDAAKLSDEDWSARLDEIAELVGVKPDEAGEAGGSTEETVFSREEVAASQVGARSDAGGEVKSAERSSVIGGLFGQSVSK